MYNVLLLMQRSIAKKTAWRCQNKQLKAKEAKMAIELAYELAPTTNQKILEIDELLSE